MDSLCQVAPHIIIDEHVQPCSEAHPRKGLYHRMVVKERDVLEQHRRHRMIRMLRDVAARVREWHTHEEQEEDSEPVDPLDPEEIEAEMLAEAAKEHALAAAYNKSVSGTHLMQQIRASMAKGMFRKPPPEYLQLYKDREANPGPHELPQSSSAIEHELRKDGITITVWLPHLSDRSNPLD